MAALSLTLSQLRRWLARPVIEHAGEDRPFRLRLVSLLLLAGGWAIFLASCGIGLWLGRQHIPVRDVRDVFGGVITTVDRQPLVQWAYRVTEMLGAVSFFVGLASVSLFDKRDRIPLWRVD